MVDFGNRLKELRQRAGMTQKQLAEKLGVTSSVVSYYELSERNPAPDVVVKLASIFHVTADYLLGIEHENRKTLDLLQHTASVLRSKKQRAKKQDYHQSGSPILAFHGYPCYYNVAYELDSIKRQALNSIKLILFKE